MELALLVYAVSLLDNLLNFLKVISFVVALATVGFGIACAEGYGDTSVPKMWLKRCVITIFTLGFISVIIPSERTAYIMVAAYATQKIAQAPEVRETGDKVLTLINSRLDQLILEAQPAQKKGK